MRTTLNIDNDVMAAVKKLAAKRRRSVGEVISSLLARALRLKARTRNGVPLLPIHPNGKRVTLRLVNKMRDDLI
jgi:hypothetical protein